MTEHGNYCQRVFDAVPVHPETVTFAELIELVPLLSKDSVRRAIIRLRRNGYLEAAEGLLLTYRRTAGATRPTEGRGGARFKR